MGEDPDDNENKESLSKADSQLQGDEAERLPTDLNPQLSNS